MEISSTYFPPEIASNILVFLPTKSILRFRCVCKSWRDLIDGLNPDFTRKNINYQRSLIEKNDNCTVILPRCFVYDDRCYSHYDSISEAVIFANALNRNVAHPANLWEMRKRVWGCCDGLVCIVVDDGTVMLWNPTINSYKTLPHHRPALYPPYRSLKHWIGGIGYDASSDDYKILWACCKASVFVFSVKFNSWKKIEEPFPYVAMYTDSVFVNGRIYMVVISRNNIRKTIVSFDVATEKFKKLALPSSVNDTTDLCVFVIKGMRGVFRPRDLIRPIISHNNLRLKLIGKLTFTVIWNDGTAKHRTVIPNDGTLAL